MMYGVWAETVIGRKGRGGKAGERGEHAAISKSAPMWRSCSGSEQENHPGKSQDLLIRDEERERKKKFCRPRSTDFMSPQQWNHWRRRWCDCKKCFAIEDLSSTRVWHSPCSSLAGILLASGECAVTAEADGTLAKRADRRDDGGVWSTGRGGSGSLAWVEGIRGVEYMYLRPPAVSLPRAGVEMAVKPRDLASARCSPASVGSCRASPRVPVHLATRNRTLRLSWCRWIHPCLSLPLTIAVSRL